MKYLLSAALFAGLAPAAFAQDMENPFKKAKVGDWAEYKMATNAMGINIDAKLKMTVTAKTDKEVTLKTAAIVNNMELPGQETKIDLTKPYDPTNTANLPKGTEAKVEKGGEGKEKVKIGGKEYDTNWMKMKVNAKVNGMDFDSDIKVWISKDVPLSGMVKMEMKSKLADMTMELTGTGSDAK
jgi:hypothetical protein